MSKKIIALVLSAICLLTIAAFSPLRHAQLLTSWDDGEQIVDNADIRDFSWSGGLKLFRSFYLAMYQPLTSLSYMLEYRVAGLQPQLYHLTNLSLHLLNILLVYWLSWLLFKRRGVALVSAALFALWPTQVEPVAWLSARSTLLSSTLILGTLISYQHFLTGKRRANYWLSLALAALAMLAKSVAVAIVPLLLLLDWQANRLNRRNLINKLPFALLALGAGLLTIVARHNEWISNPTVGFSKLNVIVMTFNSLNWQLSKLVWPFNPSPFYPQSLNIFNSLPASAYLNLIPAAILVAAVWYYRRQRLLVFCSLWFICHIILSISIMPYCYQVATDRYNYLALLALIWPLALLWDWSSRQAWRWLSQLALAILLLALTFTVWGQAQVWRSDTSLWSYTQMITPQSWLPLKNLIIYSEKSGALIVPLKNLEQLISKDPDNAKLIANAAQIKLKLAGDNQQLIKLAAADLERAKNLAPDELEIAYSYAQALLTIGRIADAKQQLNQVIDNPRISKSLRLAAQLNRGFANLHLQRWQEADLDLSAYLAESPKDGYAALLRGHARLQLQQTNEACQDFAAARLLGQPEAPALIAKHCH